MALAPTHIADKSALARIGDPAVAEVLQPLIRKGLVATCGVIELEILFSARSAAEISAVRATRAQGFPRIPIAEAHFSRAEQMILLLAEKGQHRSVGIADLLIAAVAEDAHLTLLHYDQDFDNIASVTGQPTSWVVPRGSVS